MDYCGKLVEERIGGEIFAYIDDLALISEAEEILQRFLDVWEEVLHAK